MQKHLSIFLAGALAVSGAATSFTPAAAMPLMTPAVVTESASGGSILEVRSRHRGWRHCRHGCWRGHHSNWRPRHFRGHRHHHARFRFHHHDHDDDFGAAAAAGIFGFAAGAILSGALSHGGSGYHGTCAQKYRSYDPASGTYLGYDGYRHQCVLR